MKFLKRFVLLILILALVAIGVGYVLPDSARVERSVRIDAPPAAVFPYLNDFRKFNEWSPWADWAPDIQYTYTGPESGVGARLAWESDDPQVGAGSNLIVESKPPERITTRLEMGTGDNAKAYFDVESVGDGSRVSWGFETEFQGSIIKRYFGLMMQYWVGQDYEKGLQNLKTLVEKQSARAPAGE